MQLRSRQKDEADTEDFFTVEFFAKLLNCTYNLSGEHELTAQKLEEADKNIRLTKKSDAYFRTLPPEKYKKFTHYGPADYLLRNPELLDEESDAVKQSLDIFENVFKKINKYTKFLSTR